jgi:hypothetical protein
MPESKKTKMSKDFVDWASLVKPDWTDSQKDQLFGAFKFALSYFWVSANKFKTQDEYIQSHIQDLNGVSYALSTIKTGVSQTCIELGSIIEIISPDDDQSIHVKPIKLIAVSWIIYNHLRRQYKYDNRFRRNSENLTTWETIENSSLGQWLQQNAELFIDDTDNVVNN